MGFFFYFKNYRIIPPFAIHPPEPAGFLADGLIVRSLLLHFLRPVQSAMIRSLGFGTGKAIFSLDISIRIRYTTINELYICGKAPKVIRDTYPFAEFFFMLILLTTSPKEITSILTFCTCLRYTTYITALMQLDRPMQAY